MCQRCARTVRTGAARCPLRPSASHHAAAPRRLVDRRQHQQPQHEIRYRHHEEDELPRTHCADDRQRRIIHRREHRDQGSAEHQREPGARRESEIHEGDRLRKLGRREVVGKDRIGRRPVARAADAGEQSRREELPEPVREPGQCAADTHRQQADAEYEPATERVDETRDRQARNRVERGSRKSDDEAHLRVGEHEVALDRLHQQPGETRAAEQRHDREAEDGDAVPRAARTRPGPRLRRRRKRTPRACRVVVQGNRSMPAWYPDEAATYFAYGRVSIRARPHGLRSRIPA